MPLATTVQTALEALDAGPVDRAAADLALTYAAAIDAGEDLGRLGPALLSTLEALGMTPRARAAVKKGVANAPAGNPLDELRARRAARQHRAEVVDPTAS